MSHVHVAGQIEYRGKIDSVYIVCMYCERVECVGVWFVKPPKGWSKKHWPKLHAAICLYLDSIGAMHSLNKKKYGLMANCSPLLTNSGDTLIYK